MRLKRLELKRRKRSRYVDLSRHILMIHTVLVQLPKIDPASPVRVCLRPIKPFRREAGWLKGAV